MGFFLNKLHSGLGGTKKLGSSIVHKVFQGLVEIVSTKTKLAGEEECNIYIYCKLIKKFFSNLFK